MVKKRLLPGLLVMFAFLAGSRACVLAASPVEFPGEKANPKEGTAQLIARSKLRISRDHAEIKVYRNNRPLLLRHFRELVAATPADPRLNLDRLVGKSVALVPSMKHQDELDIYLGVGGVGGVEPGGLKLVLAENIFKVKHVFLSLPKNQIEVHINGEVRRLRPGQALLVL